MARTDVPADRPPSVDALARAIAGAEGPGADLPHPLLVDAARAAVARGRGRPAAEVEDLARHLADERARTLLQPVVNATGVLLHTNLGRAPLAVSTPGRASNVELDLATGERGDRTAHAGALLARAVGAEAGLVVNNCAAGMLLVLAALAGPGEPGGPGRGVAVSRGELVEIGGGFRVPDVMARSGCRLVEVGTTNRTRLADYRTAVDAVADLAMLLKVHQSNYRIEGFTEDTSVAALAGLGRERDLPVVVDLGSGLLDAACPWLDDGPPPWLADEPAARQTLEAGADLVVFSGDKLLGGPQAGIVLGSADLVRRCARHPLYRAFRPGGLVLAALQDLALAYLDRTADRLPFWRMATATPDGLRARAEALVAAVRAADLPGGADAPAVAVVDTEAVAGGGTLPGIPVPSVGVAVEGDVRDALRRHRPPVVARVLDDRTVLDLRTVEPDDDAVVAEALVRALVPGGVPTGPAAGDPEGGA